MQESRSRFLEDQHHFFQEADAAHFLWQTQNPYFARTERDLLKGFPMRTGQAILEVGCGEGGNLVNVLGPNQIEPRIVVGVDLFERKVSFARKQLVPVRFVCGDALALPFPDAVFDLVLCRDLLHHLENRERALQELRRVCKPGATIWIVEPNGRNPLIRLLALVRPHERGQLQNSIQSLRELVARYFPSVEIEVRQPFPLHRLMLHYQFGFPRLGFSRLVAGVMDAWDRLFRAIWPREWWAYIVAKAGKSR